MENEQGKVRALDIFFAFLKLGFTSFGGPIAHIGYFRTEFVDRRGWVSDQQFAQLLATSQFLPGPASSQLGFSIGLLKAGWLGALAAFIAFTIPSVLLLVLFASLLPGLDGQFGQAAIQGLKLVACVVVADAVISMAKSLCPDLKTRVIAVASLLVLLVLSTAYAQLLVIGMSMIIGVFLRQANSDGKTSAPITFHYSIKLGWCLIAIFAALLIILPVLASQQADLMSIADAFYRAGALVFGGGHVVLPLLEDSVVSSGWMTAEQFLAGYGAAQAIPGPMFAFSAYIGALIGADASSWAFAAVATVFMFLPGFLLIAGVLPLWRYVGRSPVAIGIIAAVNAAVVGLLAAAFYDPIITSGIRGYFDAVVALVGFAILYKWRVSPLIIVLFCVSATLIKTLLMTL